MQGQGARSQVEDKLEIPVTEKQTVTAAPLQGQEPKDVIWMVVWKIEKWWQFGGFFNNFFPQTWDLTCLMYYGFTKFCTKFLRGFLDIMCGLFELMAVFWRPFLAMKFSTGGHSSAINYASTLSTLNLRRKVHGRRGKFVYQRTPLYVRELPLKKRKAERA